LAVWWTLPVLSSIAAQPDSRLSIRDFGAQPGGKTLCTAAMQAAIDACAGRGGGTVGFPPGTWLCGTLVLKSKVALELDSGCTLLGSPDLRDYPPHVPKVRSYTDNYATQSLLVGEDLEGVVIRGNGTIDGNGAAFTSRTYRDRPYLIRLFRCRDVRVEGLRLQNSGMWMQHYMACDRVTVRGLTVWNHVNRNNDGIDIDGCHDVHISGCTIDSDDDALCLKSTFDRKCENVTISDCVLSSHCNALKMGTESHGGFRNIVVNNCTIASSKAEKAIFGSRRGSSGISLEIVDGGEMEGVLINNVAVRGVEAPLFVRLGNRARKFSPDAPVPGVGTLRDVVLSNITATGAGKTGSSITGVPGHPVEGVSLIDVKLRYEGGGARDDAARPIAEKESAYPECTMFGVLPSYGLYCRHVRALKLTRVQCETTSPDLRHAVVAEDVQDLAIDGLDAQFSPGGAQPLRLTQTRGVLIRGCRPSVHGAAFLLLQGGSTADIALVGNDFRRVAKVAELADQVSREALSVSDSVSPRAK
jgi:polygalacturonase